MKRKSDLGKRYRHFRTIDYYYDKEYHIISFERPKITFFRKSMTLEIIQKVRPIILTCESRRKSIQAVLVEEAKESFLCLGPINIVVVLKSYYE